MGHFSSTRRTAILTTAAFFCVCPPTGPEAWQARLKAEKEREKAVKTKTAELHHTFRSKEVNESDLKLANLKQEERRKQQETAEMHRQFKKLEMNQDEQLLTSLKQEERRNYKN